jgi:integrase
MLDGKDEDVHAFGKPFDDSAMRRRFYKAMEAAGLSHIRFHDLRHTFGTPAVQAFPLTDVNLQAKFDAGGGTRTPDTRIMIPLL